MPMDLMAPQVIAASGPIVIDTFIKHYLTTKKKKEVKDGQDSARVDLMYDEAFTIMKNFLAIATQYPVASLQKFGLTRTPAPPWVAVHRLRIPQHSLKQSADHLVKAFGGEEMAYKVAGGTKWWRARASAGVEAEWICMKRDYRLYVNEEKAWQKKSDTEPEAVDTGFLPEMDRLRCMLYIHGGAYYWGSINTHRYTIWRYARKMKGRCFAVNYRKAPQYPFPCAIQDCLAAYLYLVNPPPGAPHRPVDPKSIIIAGDSAGGGLVWALLQILRDTPGLELPAGAVLISPWSDLTHSFPSITQNTATDVVPPYSFIHKPSSLWPPPPPALTEEVQSRLSFRVREAAEKLKVKHHDTKMDESSMLGPDLFSPLVPQSSHQASIHTSDPEAAGKLKELFNKRRAGQLPDADGPQAVVNPADSFRTLKTKSNDGSIAGRAATTLAQSPDPMNITVLGEKVTIDTQIQLYATNGQLCHPWVSPALGYLGGLCPLYILAGNDEVLRDEIIYAAHKAADPEKYPVRDDVKNLLPSLHGIEEKHGPTDVHLQVYDGAGHDLPLFSMTRPSRGAFRAIAAFCRYVTPHSPGSLLADAETQSSIGTPPVGTPPTITSEPLVESPPLTRTSTLVAPERQPGSAQPSAESELLTINTAKLDNRLQNLKLEGLDNVPASETDASPTDMVWSQAEIMASPVQMTPTSPIAGIQPGQTQYKRQGTMSSFTSKWKRGGPTARSAQSTVLASQRPQPDREATVKSGASDAPESKSKPGEAGYIGIYTGPTPFTDHMIRERVDFNGICRPLEPVSELGAFKMPAEEIGMIKEGPAMRYIEGQAIWDHKFRRTRRTIERHRKHNLKQAVQHDPQHLMRKWEDVVSKAKAKRIEREKAGTEATSGTGTARSSIDPDLGDKTASASGAGTPDWTSEEDWADDSNDSSFAWQWALDGEAPPPSAIVSRRDLPEGRQLALLAEPTNGSAAPALSLGVLLATFLGNSSADRDRAAVAVKEAKELRDEQEKEKQAKQAKWSATLSSTFRSSPSKPRKQRSGTTMKSKLGIVLGMKSKTNAAPSPIAEVGHESQRQETIKAAPHHQETTAQLEPEVAAVSGVSAVTEGAK